MSDVIAMFIWALIGIYIGFAFGNAEAKSEDKESNKELVALLTECQKKLPRDQVCELIARVVK